MSIEERFKTQIFKGGLIFIIILAGRFQSCSSILQFEKENQKPSTEILSGK
jgi:hypothetical protein